MSKNSCHIATLQHVQPAAACGKPGKDKTTRFDHLGFDDFEAFMAPWSKRGSWHNGTQPLVMKSTQMWTESVHV